MFFFLNLDNTIQSQIFMCYLILFSRCHILFLWNPLLKKEGAGSRVTYSQLEAMLIMCDR